MQQPGSMDCGPVCVQMILEYYGIKQSLEQIKKYIKVYSFGTRIYQLGLYLNQQGLRTHIRTANPKLFSKKSFADFNKNPESYIDGLKITSCCKKYLKAYANKKGSISYLIPTIEDIYEQIDEGNPLLALMTTNFLTSEKKSFNFHFVVIVGYDESRIFLHDPDKGTTSMTHEEFIFGLYASSYGDIDNGSLLVIEK